MFVAALFYLCPSMTPAPLSARDIRIADYTYDLPDQRIARHPVARRDGAKQLYFRDGEITTDVFANLPAHLPPGTLLIGNRTRVLNARLHFPLAAGKRPIEIFVLDPVEPAQHERALGARTQVQWQCLIGGNRRWKRGKLSLALHVGATPVTLEAERLERVDNTFTVAFSWQSDNAELTFGEVLEAAGTLPLPPYLGRDTEAADEDRYQTVFAVEEGSVAAPTAGLHFTPAVLEALAERDVEWREVTLHVGAGTFKPVDSPTLGGHPMHREYFSVSRAFIGRLLEQVDRGKPLVCVGTTSMRCVESLFYLARSTKEITPKVGQWAAEDPDFRERDPAAQLRDLLTYLDDKGLNHLSGYTEILLSPAARIRFTEGLITNFHQPNSTLLLLIASMIGDAWRDVYAYALANGFRFLSYGDSSLLWRSSPTAPSR